MWCVPFPTSRIVFLISHVGHWRHCWVRGRVNYWVRGRVTGCGDSGVAGSREALQGAGTRSWVRGGVPGFGEALLGAGRRS